jgi:hypothetical protein
MKLYQKLMKLHRNLFYRNLFLQESVFQGSVFLCMLVTG